MLLLKLSASLAKKYHIEVAAFADELYLYDRRQVISVVSL